MNKENECVCNKRIVLPDGTINKVCLKIGVHTCSMGAVHVINRENIGYMFENIRNNMLYEVGKFAEFMNPGIADEIMGIINDNLSGKHD
jgi:hypothetical protein